MMMMLSEKTCQAIGNSQDDNQRNPCDRGRPMVCIT
jgi:hypothetical protein